MSVAALYQENCHLQLYLAVTYWKLAALGMCLSPVHCVSENYFLHRFILTLCIHIVEYMVPCLAEEFGK